MATLSVLVALAIGLALFLFGMHELEGGVRALGGRTFQRWLSRSTASPVSSAAMGVLVTSILQSSSLVSLLVLAFASAGVLPLYNAVGVLVGANLGTTMTGWMVATIGFKLSLQALALPGMALGALLRLLPLRGRHWGALGRLIFGIGLILLGLDIMKEAVEGLSARWDLAVLRGQAIPVYFLAGIGMAGLIQSSSAVMMLTLAALNGGLLELPAAAALVIGADLGTTSTTLIGSIGGSVVKRQLALAHLLFNLVVDVLALLVVLPLLPLILSAFGLSDPLYSLVLFHSLFNLVGLLLFLPWLKPWSRWLGNRFLGGESAVVDLASVPVSVPDAALAATGRTLESMRLQAIALILHTFKLPVEALELPAELARELDAVLAMRESQEERYAWLKQQESGLLAFSYDLQAEQLSIDQVDVIQRQIREARSLSYSSKTLRDIREHLFVQRHSEQEAAQSLYRQHRHYMAHATGAYLRLARQAALRAGRADEIERLLRDNDAHYESANLQVSDMAARDLVSGTDLTNMLNVNRDLHHATKDLLRSLQEASA
ncbi:Na/Pi cotransporter family protein [Parahaliea maris]|uniref:Na/Pi cotransporter family protein n=1 Tax=Parahaliea maris TaxID=2716870 RepID=UPI00164FB980|nr:Na/Pi symporter [Parahaliea maris]